MHGKTFQIDRRKEFAALEPFLGGQGGVVCVRYYGEVSAPNSFVATLTALYEGVWVGGKYIQRQQIRRSLRIDRNNYKVRYLPEIRSEFSRKMKLDISVETRRVAETLNIGCNNTAGASQFIDVGIQYGAVSEADQIWQRDAWIKDLCGELRRFLEHGRFMIILMHGNKNEQQEFWTTIWNGGMADLVPHGLFLVMMIDETDKDVGQYYNYAPSHDVEIFLNPNLDQTQQTHAIDDIAAWACRWLDCDYSEAYNYAKSYVASNMDDLNRLYSTVGAWLMNLKRNQG